MGKRVFAVLLATVLLAAVHADVVMGNEFQREHMDEMIKLDRRRFCVNSPDGYIIAKNEPGSNEEKISIRDENDKLLLKNGEILFLESVYLYDGEYWGIMGTNHGYNIYGGPGWVPMDQLSVVYVADDFIKENEYIFYEYTGNYDAVISAERLVIWQWPGSDREKRILDSDGYEITDISAYFSYIDKDGREWGYVKINYTYHFNSGLTSKGTFFAEWICLSEPENSQIPSFYPAPVPLKWSLDGTYEWVHIDISDEPEGQYSLSNIIKVREYEPNITFTDIAEGVWYCDDVAIAYEYGIINGKGNYRFDPYGYLKGVESLVIASYVHAFYKYGYEKGNSLIDLYIFTYNYQWEFWGGFIHYCKTENLIESNRNSDFYYSLYPTTRAEMVHAWVNILQPKDVEKRNDVLSLPDVDADTPYYEDILLFYEAGILGGVDDRGTFRPDRYITRAEASVIFMRLIEADKRFVGRTYGINA